MPRARCLLLAAVTAVVVVSTSSTSDARSTSDVRSTSVGVSTISTSNDDRGPAAVHLEGRGYGHGRGMSQWGAQGAASEHGRTYRQILRFYYPGLDLGRVRGTIRVLITGDTSDDVVVRDHRRLVLRAVASGRTWALDRDGASRWRLTAANGGADTRLSVFTNRWRAVRTVAGQAELTARGPIGLVTPAGVTRYQGALRSAVASGGRDTVNVVRLEDYLRGVVPREVPALWHRQAVRAQSVAARTYAAYHRAHPRATYYDLCDTTSCQVYGGFSDHHPASDAAIRATAGEVLKSGRAPAFTEFSASNGGWTVASSVPYQVAKQDRWDPWSRNPYRHWDDVRIRATTIENAYPAIGDFQRLRVLRRDGHGAWNGRVLRIRAIGSRGSVTRTGDEFRITFGLRSTWFRVR